MSKLKIFTGEDNPVLREKSGEVKDFGRGLKKLAKQMRETMVESKGLGLAAPQVGVHSRVFVVTLGYGRDDERIVAMVNPEISQVGDEFQLGEEGCLSLPGLYREVERFARINVKFFDEDGGRQELDLEGLDARVVQHENDHLDGVLFIDRVGEQEFKEGEVM